ncbi:MAG TPA: RimK family alpha-L-glutamate ligase [Stellaceae bacterium]|nr:RimK family alpha-L-glutamate ligase [Stellaceae bacterium]
MARVAILVDEPDWHTRRLTEAFAKQGVDATVLSLRDCALVLGEGGAGVAMPGFADALPAAVLVRTIAAGSFEQVTLRLGLLHALGQLGVPVINDARAIERCVDKSMTSFLLHRAGIATPPTLASESTLLAERWRAGTAAELVAKPLFGSQGRGLVRFRPDEPLPPAEQYAGVHYLQRFVGREEGWRDFRVMVIGGEPVAAMLRHGRSWVTNVRRGARCEAVAAAGDLAARSIAAAAAVGADYAGVDLIEDGDGRLLVLEVNSMPAWKGLQSVAACDLAAKLAAHVRARAA